MTVFGNVLWAADGLMRDVLLKLWRGEAWTGVGHAGLEGVKLDGTAVVEREGWSRPSLAGVVELAMELSEASRLDEEKGFEKLIPGDVGVD